VCVLVTRVRLVCLVVTRVGFLSVRVVVVTRVQSYACLVVGTRVRHVSFQLVHQANAVSVCVVVETRVLLVCVLLL
jgi:hypothetical protein